MAQINIGPMALIAGNSGGNVNQTPNVNVIGGRVRAVVAPLSPAALAAAAGTTLLVGRVPAFASLISVSIISDTSFGAATLQLQNFAGAYSYGPAETVTAPNTRLNLLGAAAALAPIVPSLTQCFDGVSGASVLGYEDLFLVVGAAALPGAFNAVAFLEYMID